MRLLAGEEADHARRLGLEVELRHLRDVLPLARLVEHRAEQAHRAVDPRRAQMPVPALDLEALRLVVADALRRDRSDRCVRAKLGDEDLRDAGELERSLRARLLSEEFVDEGAE